MLSYGSFKQTAILKHHAKSGAAFAFWKEGMTAVVHKDLMQRSRQKMIQLKDLKDLPLIYYERYASLLQELFLEEGFLPHTLCINQDARTTLLWASSRLGIAIVPKSAWSLVSSEKLLVYDILDERLTTDIVIITSKDHYRSDVSETFLTYYRNDGLNI